MQQVRIQLIASHAFIKAVDEWRRRQDDLPNRSEAIRRLVLERLAAGASPAQKVKGIANPE